MKVGRQKINGKRVLRAAAKGRLAKMKEMIESKGVNVNYIGYVGKIALLEALEIKQMDIVRYLVEEKGADLDIAQAKKKATDDDVNDGMTALMFAVTAKRVLDMARYLVEKEVDMDKKDRRGNIVFVWTMIN